MSVPLIKKLYYNIRYKRKYFYELDELDDEDDVELLDESLSESEVSLDEELEEESLSLDDELDFVFLGDFCTFVFLIAGSSEVASALAFRFLFKIFVRLSLITIFRLFLHSYV